jgi:hypothetical protein
MTLEEKLLLMLDEMVQVVFENAKVTDYWSLNVHGQWLLDDMAKLKGGIIAHANDAAESEISPQFKQLIKECGDSISELEDHGLEIKTFHRPITER